MDQRVGVIEDGVTERPQSERPRASKTVAGVAFLLGVGVGLLATSGASPTATTVPGAALDRPEEVEASPAVDKDEKDEGVAAVIADFPDALVAVARASGSTVDYLLWPVAGELSIRPAAGGGDATLDATSQFVALTTSMPDGEGSLLSTGRHHSIRPVASNVTSYAFHDTATGLLAYTRVEDGTTRVLMIKSGLDPEEIATFPQPDVALVGWGDWGWALQRTTDEIVLLTADGRIKDTEPGLALATHPSGWLFARDGNELKLVSAGGGVRVLVQDVEVGTAQSASFSPDGSKIAIDGELGLGVLDIDSGDVVIATESSVGPTGWSSDSRFVLAATSSGVLVFDLETGETTTVLREYSIMAVGAFPLPSS